MLRPYRHLERIHETMFSWIRMPICFFLKSNFQNVSVDSIEDSNNLNFLYSHIQDKLK